MAYEQASRILAAGFTMTVKRQATAMWALGLLWFAFGIASLEGASSEGILLGRLAAGFVLLVSLFFVIFSLRPRHKADHTHHGLRHL